MRIAIIGSGISGLGAAWALRKHHAVTLFEAETRLGGHTLSLDITLDGSTQAVDTGFMVFNELTYPQLLALFRELGIRYHATDMSLSVSLEQPQLEWSGQSLSSLFADRRNLFRPRFWGLLRDIVRFNRLAPVWLALHGSDDTPLGKLLDHWGFSAYFRQCYLFPMAAAIWSCPTATVADFPAANFIAFCVNHRLLQVANRPSWYTVEGGAAEYVRRIAAGLDDIRCGCPVLQIDCHAELPTVVTATGGTEFDAVILACHSDQSARLLPQDDPRARILQDITYQDNRVVLHTDDGLMPRRRGAWSAWNVHSGQGDGQPVAVTYWINRLQGQSWKTQLFETLNPYREPAPGTVLADFHLAHPLLDRKAIAARSHLDVWQGRAGVWLAGAWMGHGFHEDGLKSGLAAAEAISRRALAVAP